MEIIDVMAAVVKSAKLRCDYLKFERDFIEHLSMPVATRLADGIFGIVITGLAEGKIIEEINAEAKSQLTLVCMSGDFAEFISEVKTVCKQDVDALVMARAYSQMDMSPQEVFEKIRPDLYDKKPHPEPNSESANRIRDVLMKPVFESAKVRLDGYASYVKKERAERGDAGSTRVENILQHALSFMSANDEISERKTYDFLVSRMKPGTEPDWLRDFTRDCYENLQRERCVLAMLDMAWAKGMSEEDILEEVKFRLRS